MANYEHFSSTFRRFSIYASRHYPTNNWDLLGSFVGSNIRKLQEFKLNFSAEEIVEGDAPYYGYMKLVIHDYHGLEYYYPISTLQVISFFFFDFEFFSFDVEFFSFDFEFFSFDFEFFSCSKCTEIFCVGNQNRQKIFV